MYIGRVVGTVVATVKHPHLAGQKLLLVQREMPDGTLTDAYDICLDVVQAGEGDRVLVLDEGNSARQILGMEPYGAVRAVVVGVVDRVDVEVGA